MEAAMNYPEQEGQGIRISPGGAATIKMSLTDRPDIECLPENVTAAVFILRQSRFHFSLGKSVISARIVSYHSNIMPMLSERSFSNLK